MINVSKDFKVVVIGGSGFIGTKLVQTLLDNNNHVTIFDKVASTQFPEISIVGDVRDSTALTNAMIDHDVIINLAAEHRDDVYPKSLYYEVNVLGMANIIASADINNIRRIIFTSTVALYPLNQNNPDENSHPDPFNDYGRSKLEAEKLLLKWAEKLENSCLVLRPSVVIGDGNRGNVYNLIKQIETGYFVMIGDGKNKKSMCHVQNLVNFIQLRLSLHQTELFNFVDKPDLTTNEIVAVIRGHLKLTKSFKTRLKIPYWIGLIGGIFFDLISHIIGKSLPISSIRIKKFTANTIVSSKSLESTGFTPIFSLQEGLRSMIFND